MKSIIIIIAAALTIVLFTGCKKWLNVPSKTDVVQTDMFKTEQGFTDAAAGAYLILTGNNLYGDHLTLGLMDVIARRYKYGASGVYVYPAYFDNTGYDKPSGAYYKDDGIKPMVENIWDSMYNAIANANNILANIEEKKSLFTQNNYNLLKGEMIGLRGFVHLDLLRMFGHAYATYPDSLCMPYVRNFGAKIITPLSTVRQVADSVIEDLNTALELLKDDDINSSSSTNEWVNKRKCHFNKWAAEATLARAYLFKGDKVNALLHATNVINGNQFRFSTTAELSLNIAQNTFPAEQIFALYKTDIKAVYELHFTVGIKSDGLSNDFYPNVQTIYEADAGGATDLRLNLWVDVGNGNYANTKYSQRTVAEAQNLMPLIRLPEMYYIAAECSTGAQAIGYLNTVREKRALHALPLNLNAANIKKEIFKEYQKEFYCEGQLFYFYKRLNYADMIDSDGITEIPIPGSFYKFPMPDDEKLLRGIN